MADHCCKEAARLREQITSFATALAETLDLSWQGNGYSNSSEEFTMVAVKRAIGKSLLSALGVPEENSSSGCSPGCWCKPLPRIPRAPEAKKSRRRPKSKKELRK